MTETERWLFIEFLKMETRAEKAEAALVNADLKSQVAIENLLRIQANQYKTPDAYRRKP